MKFAIFFFVIILLLGCTIPNLPKPIDPTPQPDPQPTTCSDSDGGLSVYVKGTTTNGTLTVTDVCNGNSILEYYCDGDGLYQLSQPCVYGCANGSCNHQSNPQPTPAQCTDSDGGSNFNVKGTATNGTFTLTDICDESSVVEYVCQGTAIYEILQPCNHGCTDGKCNSGSDPNPCTDTDSGQDVNVKGIAAKGTLIMEDMCNGTSILEYFCSENDMYELSQVCPYGCSDGRCNSASDPQPTPATSTCTDSDNGINYAVKGTLTSNGESHTDFCSASAASGKLLWEYYCKAGGGFDFEFYTCPVYCTDGKCTTSSTPTTDPDDDNSCTSHSSCGYKKRCIGGKCVSVQCTSDSQCSGCKRCSSSWTCVNCGYGASGYCTC